MKKIIIFVVVILFGIFLFKTSEKHTQENPVNTYLDNRVDTIELAKKSVNESNNQTEEQNKVIEAVKK